MANSDYVKALREAMAANDDLRKNLYEMGEDVADIARTLAPEDEGTFRESIESRPVRYRKLGKSTRVARVISTDDPEKVATLEYGRDGDDENGPAPAFETFKRTAAYFNSPPDEL